MNEMSGNSLQKLDDIKSYIYTIRGKQVMLDRDLAGLYGVETKRLNEQVRRNINRFPEEFMFQLSKTEMENWKSQFATSNLIKMGLRKLPFAFTEQKRLDVKKFNDQFPEAEIIEFNISHDRFIIIDEKTIYLLGASMKDLGRKWFGFAKMDVNAQEVLKKAGVL